MKIRLGLTICASVVAMAAAMSAANAAKDSVTIGLQLEPPHLDPTAGAAGAIDDVTYSNIFEGLTRINKNGAVLPALAKSWEISDDGLTYVFSLNTGVKFHDGTDMDADDVVFSFNRILSEDSVNAQKALFAAIESVTATNASTVTMKLKQQNGNMLFNLGWGDAVIVAPESAETNKANPVGTGPFMLDKWTKGDSIELKRNDGYWGPEKVLASAKFRIISEPAAAFAALMAGDVDAFPTYPAPENLPQFDADPRFRVVIGSTEGETILSTNNTMPPLDNVLVRRAVSHAINRQEIIDGAMFGYGTPIGTHFAPHHPAYKDLTGNSNYDPGKAKALLAEAGMPDGFTATLKLPPPSYARRGGEIIAAQLRAVGINVEISNLEWAQWLDEVFKQTNYHFTIVSHTEPLDIAIYARDTYYFNYKSDAFNAVIDKLNGTTDSDARYDLYKNAQTILSDDAVNGFLFQLAKTGVWAKGLEGLWENSPVQSVDLTGVHWSE
jgi:peptide/nickel transport system substrate-binding protein